MRHVTRAELDQRFAGAQHQGVAAFAPVGLAGSRTGVFVGIGSSDYTKVCVPYDNYFEQIDAHMGTGNALSIAANRGLTWLTSDTMPPSVLSSAATASTPP